LFRAQLSLVLLFGCALLASSAVAAPWDAPLGDPDKIIAAASREEAPEGASFHMLLEDARFEVDAERRVHSTIRLVYRVLNDDGVQGSSSVEAWWSPWYQETPTVQLRVIHPDGTFDDLDPTTLVEVRPSSEGEVYSERLGLEGPVPRLEVGAVIERTITTRAHRTYFDAGEIHDYDLRWEHPPVRRVLTIAAAAGVPLLVSDHGLPRPPSDKKVRGARVIRYELDANDTDPDYVYYLPQSSENGPAVHFTTGTSWQAVATAYRDRVEALLDEASVSDLAETAAGGATDPMERARKLFDWVRDEIRYTGLEFGENALIPVAPLTTMERGFGDCKDQATLLVGLLRHFGHDAHVALLKAGTWVDVDPTLPGLRNFDHAIVHVADLDLWLDPTDRFANLGQLTDSSGGRLALVARAESTELVRTPRATPEENRIAFVREIRLRPEGPADLTVRVVPQGLAGREYRGNWFDVTDANAKDYLDEKAETVWGANEVSSVAFDRTLRGDFELSYQVQGSNWGYSTDDEAVALHQEADLLAELPSYFEEGPQDEAVRALPVGLPAGRSVAVVTRVTPPPGYVVTGAPEDLDERAGPARWTRTRTDEDGAVVLTSTFSFGGAPTMSPAELASVRELATRVNETAGSYIELQHASRALMHEGSFGEALALVREGQAAHPDDPTAKIRASEVLLAAGVGNGARAVAEEVVAAHPEFARGWRALAAARGAGVLGEERGPGWDRDGAIAAWRKVVELEPDDEDARIDLISALEHAPSGTLRDAGANLREAGEQGLAALELGIVSNLADATMSNFLMAGATDEVRSLLASAWEISVIARVAGYAQLDGADAASREARRVSRGAAEVDEHLVGAFSYLIQLGLFEGALAVGELIVGPQSPPAAREALERIREVAEVDLGAVASKNTPAAAAIRTFVPEAVEPRPEPSDVFSRTLLDVERDGGATIRQQKTEAWEGPGGRIGVVRSLVGTGSVDTKMLASDLAKVKLEIAAKTTAVMYVFVVKEKGRWLTLGSPGEDPLIEEARRRVARKDLAAARALLGESPAIAGLFGDLVLDELGATELGGLADSIYCPKTQTLACAKRADAASKALTGPAGRTLARSLPRAWLELGELARAEAAAWDVAAGNVPATLTLVEILTERAKLDEAKELIANLREESAYGAFLGEVRLVTETGTLAELQALADALDTTEGDTLRMLNNVSWGFLFFDDSETAIELAERAVATEEGRDPFKMHTLATAYATAGRSQAARRTLLQLRKLPGGDANANDHYVLGLISEDYGLHDLARAAYEQIPEPTHGKGLSTWLLAQRRLEGLAQ